MGGKSCQALILILCCWLASCKKDKPDRANISVPHGTGNLYIACEGNFGNGDATLYSYDPIHATVYNDLYSTINGQPLGDVLQSIQHIGNRLFLCVNNSDKVVVLDDMDLKLVATLSIPKPRYIVPVSSTTAYVSALYSNKVYVLNLQQMRVTDTIDLPGQNPEGMCVYNNNVIVCTWDTARKKIYSIDIANGRVGAAIEIGGYAPQEALLDKEQMLWVLAGEQYVGKTSTWTRLDPSTGQVLKTYTFPAEANVVRPVFNKAKDTLYFIEANQGGGTANNGVYRMGIHDEQLPLQPFVAARQFQYFWALGIDPVSGNVYVGDPRGFVQKGIIYIYQPDGTLLQQFTVGLGPGHFYFDD